MKTVGFWCLSLGISWCFLTSCQDEWNGANDTRSDMQTAEWDGVVYPSSKYYHPMTKGMESFETDWETLDHVIYPGEEKIATPWSQDAVTNASLPYDFAYDVKKEDGWKMLFHTFTEGQGSRRYIGLYNQRTGMLKVFYYLKDSQLNNTGVWQLNLGANQEYLNHTGEFAIPVNVANVDGWGCTNATIVETKAFERGWNGFQVQLAYTPNISSPYKLAINTYASNVGDVDLFGENYAYSEGTIITYEGTRPKDNLGNSNFVSVSGKSAEEFILRATNKCTYLKKEDVLPAGSLLFERYKVLNELNTVRIRGEKLPVPVKQKVYKDLFCRHQRITGKRLAQYLKKEGYYEGIGPEDISGIDQDFQASLKSLLAFKQIHFEVPISDSVMEDMIRDITLFGADQKLLKKRSQSGMQCTENL